jgi:glycosyltransferase involved in cell wall biosynthesis
METINRSKQKRMIPISKATTLIAIPVFNEIKYLDSILQAVIRYSKHILVIDDGSTDGTSEALKKYELIDVLSHCNNTGYGRSLIDAFNYADKKAYDWIITMDCDHQHEPSYIPSFLSEIEKNKADIISGSRYLAKTDLNVVGAPLDRVSINKEITAILNRNLGLKLTDSFCGFKAYRTKSITSLALTEQGYGFPLQLWIQAVKEQLRIREIAVPLIYYDPKRNFNGILDNPSKRLDYYLEIIEKELGYNVSQNVNRSFCSQAKGYDLSKS